jgi:poly-gamma-glutamate capsule biosynthesis protein CapA/YwtB (metallophosphatase superfamily)
VSTPTRTAALRGAVVVALLASAALLPRVEGARAPSQPDAASAAAPVRPAPDARAAGRQPLCFVVHPTHPPLDLPWQLAYRLVTGRVETWRAVDGRDAPLRLVLGPAAAARAAGIWLLAGRAPSRLAIASSETAAAEAVAADPLSLGVVAAEVLSPAVRAASLAGVDPTRRPDAFPLAVPGGAAGPVIDVVVVGDVLTSRGVDRAIVARGDPTAPFREVAARLAAADLALGNFEGTISARIPPRPGGTAFVSRPAVVEGLRAAGFDVLSLANNHAGDFGGATLLETIRRLRDAGIATVGAGADEAAAREPAVLERKGVRFAVLAFNSIVGTPPPGPGRPGAVRIRMAPWFPFSQEDLDRVAEDVRRARARADVVIVFPHWGQEYVTRPVADQVRVAHALLEAGADLVVGTHPHWVQGAEIHRGRLVAYSLGNFVFDQTWSVETQQGAALELVFWGRRLVAASFTPVAIEEGFRPRLLDPAAGAEILARIWGASGEPYRRAA